MSIISDETLMAYADGELQRGERRVVRDALSKDPSLAVRLERYIFTSPRRLSLPFDAVMQQVPQRLLEFVQGADRTRPVAERRAGGWLVEFANSFRMPMWAVAGAASLLVGATLGTALTYSIGGSDSRLAALQAQGLVVSGSLQHALDNARSGPGTTALAEMEVKSTFRNKSAEWCRQIEVDHAAGQRTSAVACRGEDGQWRFAAHAALPPRGKAPAGSYAPASGAGAPQVEAAIDSMIKGGVLGTDEEDRLIAGKWKSSP
jgi:hypothetical protein